MQLLGKHIYFTPVMNENLFKHKHLLYDKCSQLKYCLYNIMQMRD